jgi:hypothetical protein
MEQNVNYTPQDEVFDKIFQVVTRRGSAAQRINGLEALSPTPVPTEKSIPVESDTETNALVGAA